MNSIRSAQLKRAIGTISKALYSRGVKPSEAEVNNAVSKYFSENPIGIPLSYNVNDIIADNSIADPEAINTMMLKSLVNLEVLYEVAMLQADDSMSMVTELRDRMALLERKRRRATAELDDIMQSMYNSDGYYYSMSDGFYDISMVDLSMTSLYIDVESSELTLPVVSHWSNKVRPENLTGNVSSVMAGGETLLYDEQYPMTNAFDGLTNTVWSMETKTANQARVTTVILINISSDMEISRVDINPYGVSQSQWLIEYGIQNDAGGIEYRPFGGRVLTTVDKFSMLNDPVMASTLRITINKDEPDYISNDADTNAFRYIFGMKDIEISYSVFDAMGSMVSIPLSIPSYSGIYDIDSVSITTDQYVPDGTSMNFYIAEEDGVEKASINDYNWQRVKPVDMVSSPRDTVIRFDGTQLVSRIITPNPTGDDSIERIPLDTVNQDMRERNPTTSILDGDYVYRIARLEDTPVEGTIKLEEGINSVRIYHTELSDFAIEDLSWWADKLDEVEQTESRIDIGNSFFYGGDIGESGRSVLVETYVDIATDVGDVFSDFKKNDANSKLWKVRAFLNGREIGLIDEGQDLSSLTWPFRKGLNHVALLINIPYATRDVRHPYIGSVTLLSERELTDIGRVRLGNLPYVDKFDMKYNQRPGDRTFSLIDGEIVSRSRPHGDLMLTYNRSTHAGPNAIRLRVDMDRSNNHSTLSPVLSEYRVRFSYDEGDVQ